MLDSASLSGDFSEVGEALDRIELIERLFGFWSASIEEPWQDGRYKREYSSWWLLIPLHIDSEIATVRQTEPGVEFTLELYPADETSFEERFDQLRKDLGIEPGERGPNPLRSIGNRAAETFGCF